MEESGSCCQDPPKRRREDVVSSPTHATDRISQLSRPTLHHILSFLPTKDVVRTGVLSKTWHHTSTSFPISVYYETLAGHARGSVAMEEWRPTFVNFVLNSLRSQYQIYGTIPDFQLYMTQHSPHTSCIEECIQLATQNRVKVLHIIFELSEHLPRFILPHTLFSAKELAHLLLYGCHLSMPPAHCVSTWPFLRHLFLHSCHVDEQLIQNLTISCPLLELLALFLCVGFGDIRLSGFTKLTNIQIVRPLSDSHAITVKVDVPSLKELGFFSPGSHCIVNLTASKNLTILKLKLKYSSQKISSQDLADLISRLPALKTLLLDLRLESIKFSSQQLENLDLYTGQRREADLNDLISGLPALKFLSLTCMLERIKFSSEQLENLNLVCLSKLLEVSIDAPCLKTFKCSGEMLSSDLFMGRSSPQEVTIDSFSCGASSFLKLRKFLGSFNQIKLLDLVLSQQSKLLPAELKDIPIPDPALPDIKHFMVSISSAVEVSNIGTRSAKRGCLALLDGFLWSCHPESISFELSSYGRLMTKVFCEELSEMVKGQRCCTDDHIKCWRHDLRSFRIKQYIGNADAKFISCDALLQLLLTLPSEVENLEIHFMLECNFVLHFNIADEFNTAGADDIVEKPYLNLEVNFVANSMSIFANELVAISIQVLDLISLI